MALTIAVTGKDVIGTRFRNHGTIAFDSSYPTGGESFAWNSFGLFVGDNLTIEPKNGFTFEVDYTNKLIKAYYSQPLGVLSVNTTAAVATGTTTEQTLMSYALPASAMGANGQALRVKAWGITAGNTNDKTIKLSFGAATVVSTGAVASNNKDWYLDGVIVRTGAATQEVLGTGRASATVVDGDRTTASEDLTAAVTVAVKVTLGTASATDISQNGMIVELLGPSGAAGATGIEVVNAASLASLTGVRWTAVGV